MKYLLLILVVITVVKVGNCTHNFLNSDRCGAQLSNGIVTELTAPVMEGQEVYLSDAFGYKMWVKRPN